MLFYLNIYKFNKATIQETIELFGFDLSPTELSVL